MTTFNLQALLDGNRRALAKAITLVESKLETVVGTVTEYTAGEKIEIMTGGDDKHSYDEIGVGGRLLSDIHPELREKERRVREERG